VTTDVVDDRRAMRVAFDARAIAARLVVDVVNIVVAVRARVCRVIDIGIGIGVQASWGDVDVGARVRWFVRGYR
jgi:hypothetical protein